MFALRHGIRRVGVTTNPLDLGDFVALVRLAEAHEVYHVTFFLSGAQLDEHSYRLFESVQVVSGSGSGRCSNSVIVALIAAAASNPLLKSDFNLR